MRKTRLLAMLLAILMIVGTIAIIPVTASTAWDGETIAQPAGKGTKEEPFLIANGENLAWVSYMTKNFTELNDVLDTGYISSDVFEGMYFVQTADIDLGGHEFDPIGFTQATDVMKRNAFAGHYDGRSYKISNAVITPDSQVKKTVYGDFMEAGYHPGGLFGVLAAGSTVSNVNACNIKVGAIKTNTMLRNRIYTLTVAGVIVGSTSGNVTITNCTTDAECVVYAFYAAGGILGMPEGGAYLTQCVNSATVSGCVATGGIVGQGNNTDVSYSINKGKVAHYSTDRWSSAGGIMGGLLNVGANKSNSVSYCINEGEISATCLQEGGSGTNRVALGGMLGHDGIAANADMKYSYCYNMQKHFKIKYLDNGNSAATHLAMCGSIVGNTRDSANATGVRTFEYCYGVAGDYTYDWTAISAESVLGGNGKPHTDKTKLFAFDWNEQSGEGAVSSQPYAGIVGSELSQQQATLGLGDPTVVFATCEYGVRADDLKEHAEYQAIVNLIADNAALSVAPKYVGVQETLDKSAGNYELRFILATNRTDYYQAGVEIIASYGEGQMKTFVLTADKYHNSLSGKKADGTGVNYTPDAFGGEKLMALTLAIDLATYGAVSYAVTPYFIEAEGGEAAYGRTWTVNYSADGFFAGQSIVEPAPEDDDTALYTIVYPDDSVLAPEYTVVGLQFHIFSKRGIKMPIATERSTDPDAYEIVIAEDPTMETGHFTTAVEGNRLIVTAGDTFGYIAASQRLTKQLFANGRMKLSEACNTSGVYEREMIPEKVGETRVIFQNVWIRAGANSPEFKSITGYEYQLALVALYQPDVIGFNEFLEGWRASGFIEAMAEIGYVEAQPIVNGQPVTNLGDCVFYNTNTTELIENSARYLSYGSYKSVDTDGDGVSEAQLRNTGEFAGRYYDNSDNRWLCATVATFKDKTSEKEYSVCCTHFESNGSVDPQIAPLGNPLRMEQVEKLLPFLNAYQAEFGTTVLLGGDYNSADYYEYKSGGYSAKGDTTPWYFDWSEKNNNHSGGYIETPADRANNKNGALTTYPWHDGTTREYLWGACDELAANGFINCREETRDTAHNHSCNGYPTWNADLKAYVGFSAGLTDDANKSAYAGSIDHIYALESFEGELDTIRYRNLSIETILSSSDHKPVMIDFNLNDEGSVGGDEGGSEGGEGGEGGDEIVLWQGMDDYAAPTKGNGTEKNPYLIENAQHLAWLARMVEDAAAASEFLGVTQEARKVFAAVHFKQTADIDLNNKEFMPIGSYMSASSARHLFGGVYDGDGFKIMNAKISMADHIGQDYYKNTEAPAYVAPANLNSTANADLAGHYDALFNISAGAVIRNVNAVNVHTGNYDAEHTNSMAAGIICGFIIEATILNCTTDETSSATAAHAAGMAVVTFGGKGSTVKGCTNNATIDGTAEADGILVYPIYTTDKVEECTNNGQVSKG